MKPPLSLLVSNLMTMLEVCACHMSRLQCSRHTRCPAPIGFLTAAVLERHMRLPDPKGTGIFSQFLHIWPF